MPRTPRRVELTVEFSSAATAWTISLTSGAKRRSSELHWPCRPAFRPLKGTMSVGKRSMAERRFSSESACANHSDIIFEGEDFANSDTIDRLESASITRMVPGLTGVSTVSPSGLSSRISIVGCRQANRNLTAPQIDNHQLWPRRDAR